MSEKPNRRAILACAATIPALALPAAAVATPAATDELDREAIVARAQQIVDVLADCYVGEGWHEAFDMKRAAEFVDAVRKQDWQADNDPAFLVAFSWLRDHGQSADWLYGGDPAGLICGAAKTSPAAAAIPAGSDPILVAIDQYRQVATECFEASRRLDQAEGRLRDAGHEWPCPLIAWRNYSAIGGSEIERARDEFLALPGANKELIEWEYRDAKRRRQHALLREQHWYRAHGIAELKADSVRLWGEFDKVKHRLEVTMPTTLMGAAALVSLIRKEQEEHSDFDWHLQALANAADALRAMEAQS